MDTATYHANEIDRAYREMRRHELAPLSERKAAEVEYLSTLKGPHYLAREAGNIFAGNYGYGAQALARQWCIGRRKGTNTTAHLGALVAAFVDGCPARHARKAWRRLTDDEKAVATRVLVKAVAEATAELAAEE